MALQGPSFQSVCVGVKPTSYTTSELGLGGPSLGRCWPCLEQKLHCDQLQCELNQELVLLPELPDITLFLAVEMDHAACQKINGQLGFWCLESDTHIVTYT